MTTYNSQTITLEQLAKTIDHSLLKPELTDDDVRAGCELALRYHAASVCVKPCHVKLADSILRGTDVAVGTVIGFPHGSTLTAVKVFEVEQALADGAVELDMVINIGALRSGRADDVRADIAAVVAAARKAPLSPSPSKFGGALVKVIFENAYLTDEQKVLACQLTEAAGADYVKTSTGYAPTGATVEDLKLMRASVSERVEVKAAQGVRTLDALLAVIDAGAIRVGATATATMLDEFKTRKETGRPLVSSATLETGY
jgi:deoxyribose-phosphate aldolase